MTHDVFISYAHADNEIEARATVGWVTSMVAALRKRVREILGGAPPDIWMDHALQPNEVVSDALQTLAAGSRTLVLVMSRGYLKSRWCQMELAKFLETHAATKNKESVFIAEIYPTDRNLWHARLRNLTQIPFWEQKFGESAPRQYGYPIPNPLADHDRPFFERINEMAHFLAKRLEEIRVEAVPGEERPVVWIGEPPIEDSGLILQREGLARTLRQAGAEVIPGGVGAYPRDSVSVCRDEIAADIARSRLLVQLFGSIPGGPLPGTELSIPRLQDELARVHAPSYLRWRSPEIDLETVPDVAWRELLRPASASSPEEFKHRVLRALRGEPQRIEIPAEAGPVLPGPSPSQLTISVNATPADAGLRDQVAAMLEDLDASVLMIPDPAESTSSATYRAEFERVVGESDGVVIVYGSAPAAWAMSAFQFSKKILAQSRRGIWGALVDGPASPKVDHGIRARKELMILDCRQKALERSVLEPFVTTLRGRGATGALHA